MHRAPTGPAVERRRARSRTARPAHDARRRQGRPLSNAQLARRAYVTPQAMGEVIEKLEKMHFLKRVSHPNHRRVYPAVLLPAGIQVLKECDARVAELEAAMLHDLDDAQRLEMARALTSAVQALGAGLPQHVR